MSLATANGLFLKYRNEDEEDTPADSADSRVTPGKTDKTGHPDSLYGGMLDTVSCRALFDAA